MAEENDCFYERPRLLRASATWGIAPVLEKTLEVATAFFPIAKLDLKEAQVVEGHHV